MSGRTGWQKIARRIRVPMGFVFAAVFLWLARPTWLTMLASLVLVVPGVWLRGYASGYVKKNAELATTGPYAHTRNPLYLGSTLIAFGFAAAAASCGHSGGAGGFCLQRFTCRRSGARRPTCGNISRGSTPTPATVPRLLPRLTAAPSRRVGLAGKGGFSSALYRNTASTML